MSGLRILALEPYYGGSHKAVLDLLAERVDADWTLITLPARKWKWRMRGAAITMAAQVRDITEANGGVPPFDVIFASTFLNLAEFRGLVDARTAAVPAIVYFHENQLVYPNRHTAEWDLQFPLTNITSALSAQRCVFNTAWNRDGFLGGIDAFLREFPDHRPRGVATIIAERSEVLGVPFDPAPFDAVAISRPARCRIVWPHRWEHDKNPDAFFRVINRLALEEHDFEVAVAGQSFSETVEEFRAATESLGTRLVHCGEPASRAEYAALLASSDVAVSTADNEFFGLAMIEACRAGCAPLVPDRLAYPELYPGSMRYSTEDELLARLRGHVLHRPEPGSAASVAAPHTIDVLCGRYRDLFERVASV